MGTAGRTIDSNSAIIEHVKKGQCLDWDEASSSSQRMLKLVNVIHHCLSDVHHNHPFGEGKSLEFL